MVSFHASRVASSVELGITVITLDEVGAGAEYLIFQRDANDEPLDDAGVHMERRSQRWAARGGILRCEFHRNGPLLRVTKPTAERLGGESEYEVTFELPFREFRRLRSRLRKVFRGLTCFADESAGERLIRRPRNEFVESLDRLFVNLLGPPVTGDRCTHALVRESEEYSGGQIPPPLRDYLRFGENRVLGGARGLLLTPEALESTEDHLVFWMSHREDRNGELCGPA